MLSNLEGVAYQDHSNLTLYKQLYIIINHKIKSLSIIYFQRKLTQFYQDTQHQEPESITRVSFNQYYPNCFFFISS